MLSLKNSHWSKQDMKQYFKNTAGGTGFLIMMSPESIAPLLVEKDRNVPLKETIAKYAKMLFEGLVIKELDLHAMVPFRASYAESWKWMTRSIEQYARWMIADTPFDWEKLAKRWPAWETMAPDHPTFELGYWRLMWADGRPDTKDPVTH